MGLIVGDDLARIVIVLQPYPGKFHQRPAIGPGHLQGLVGGCLHGDFRQCRHDVTRGDRLQVGGGQPDTTAFAPGLRNALDELEKLRGPQQGVGDTRVLDQLFLSHLGPEITTFQHPLGAHHRQRHMVLDAGGGLGLEQVASRGFKEVQDGNVLE
ncbi:hypothetical protein D3C78_749120 [compost metagenome]